MILSKPTVSLSALFYISQAGSLCKICDDNKRLKAEMENIKTMFNKDIIEAIINAKVQDMLKAKGIKE